jgi:hypothetical protein
MRRLCHDGIVGTVAGRRALATVTPHRHKEQAVPYSKRAPPDPYARDYPGFYQVCTGHLVEIGDQLIDASGRTRPCSLDFVGREVTPDVVVLRVDRRQPERH